MTLFSIICYINYLSPNIIQTHTYLCKGPWCHKNKYWIADTTVNRISQEILALTISNTWIPCKTLLAAYWLTREMDSPFLRVSSQIVFLKKIWTQNYSISSTFTIAKNKILSLLISLILRLPKVLAWGLSSLIFCQLITSTIHLCLLV